MAAKNKWQELQDLQQTLHTAQSHAEVTKNSEYVESLECMADTAKAIVDCTQGFRKAYNAEIIIRIRYIQAAAYYAKEKVAYALELFEAENTRGAINELEAAATKADEISRKTRVLARRLD
jgi:hypothetical protein